MELTVAMSKWLSNKRKGSIIFVLHVFRSRVQGFPCLLRFFFFSLPLHLVMSPDRLFPRLESCVQTGS
jgi:hypothetical protein